ncbi:hypothetical protein LCGC14_0325950 [marine sediment metagenome]|uniref:Uncharacterized protein n=1 Tax=marine sediment metagenome TaxID=412755 RepID=A0A0F9TNE7_9ZZZZ
MPDTTNHCPVCEERERLIEELVEASRLMANLVEAAGHSAGQWAAGHQALARSYAQMAREAIVKVEERT